MASQFDQGILTSADSPLVLPVVFLCSMHPKTILLLLRAMTRRPALVISVDFEDPAALVARHILDHHPSVSTLMLQSVAKRLCQAPPLMASTVTRLIIEAHVGSVRDVACASAMSRRSLYRWCSKIGLMPPHNLVVAAKMLRGYTLMRYVGDTVINAGRVAGYESPKTFFRQCSSVTRMPPSKLRAMAEIDLFSCLEGEVISTSHTGRFQQHG